jgi:hypothetical protein
MSGIADYFHGEVGEATRLFWFADETRLFFDMDLRGDPHRLRTTDYGSDIGIDPQIMPGAEVVYARLDQTCGLWVERGNEFTPRLEQALARCKQHRTRFIHAYRSLPKSGNTLPSSWLDQLARDTNLEVFTRGTFANGSFPTSERPATPVSVFLSYKHQDVLLAREFYDCLKDDAKADVWFDLAQQGKAPTPGDEVETWLKQAVYSSQLFLILLTRAALQSDWVMKEFMWAAERASTEKDFHPILLNLENLTPPAAASMSVLDCAYLSLGEILEEAYALMYQRKGRREWLADQLSRGWDEPLRKPYDFEYGRTAAGEAVALNWFWQGKELHWILTYVTDGREQRVEGHGGDQIVDLGIKSGERIAFYVFNELFPVWMRSDDLSVTPRDVIRNYSNAASSPPSDPRLSVGNAPSNQLFTEPFPAKNTNAAPRQLYRVTTEVTLTPDDPGYALLNPGGPEREIDLNRTPSRVERLSEWIFISGSLVIICLVEASFFYFVYQKMLTGASDPPMSAQLAAIVSFTMKWCFATNILLFGTYFLIKFHEVIIDDGVTGTTGAARALVLLIPMALVITVLPVLAFAGVQIVYMFTLRLILQGLQKVFGGDWSWSIWLAAVASYLLFLIYFAFRTWRLYIRYHSLRSTVRSARRFNKFF